MSKDKDSKPTKRYVRIDRKKVNAALKNLPVEVVAAHLDLEGLCYIKVLRTGAHECFATDVTAKVLKDEGFEYKDQEKSFWRKPAMEKFGEPEK
jgi:hypothetical protein